MIIDIFKTSIYRNRLNDKELDKLILETLKNPKYTNINKSNIGGKQIHPNETKIEKRLLENFTTCLPDYFEGASIQHNIIKWQIKNYWINENYKYNYNMTHMHPDTHLSGVYYCKVPKNSGNIVFIDGYKDLKNIWSTPPLECSLQNSEYTITPFAGLLLLFPSYLHHYVTQSNSDDSRISLSFNINFYGSEKTTNN
tara:strand:- start:627 stop:1217 length:591 start_codon:yes stop_codon:yes gene_type:complete